jgi:hypothetical protein
MIHGLRARIGGLPLSTPIHTIAMMLSLPFLSMHVTNVVWHGYIILVAPLLTFNSSIVIRMNAPIAHKRAQNEVARPERFELSTIGSEGPCSIR